MTSTAQWRRISDWKQTLTLVDMADVEPMFVEAQGLVRPEERLKERAPWLAELVSTTHFARVDRKLAKSLHEAGVATYDVGYHRGSDGLLFVEENKFGRQSRDVDMAKLLEKLLVAESDDEAYDRVSSDAVDAVLRVFSDGLLTERAVIVAALVPPLAKRGGGNDAEETLAGIDGLDPGDLPDVTSEFVDRVASALLEMSSAHEPPPGPPLSPQARRAYLRKAGMVGLAALAIALFGFVYAPVIAVFAAPVLVSCATVVCIHGLALRQQPR